MLKEPPDVYKKKLVLYNDETKEKNGKEERLTISLNLEARPGVLRAPLAAKLGIERPIDGFKADMALVAAAAAPAYPPNG